MHLFLISWGFATNYLNLPCWVFRILYRILKYNVKKRKKISILSRPIANLCDLLKLTNYLFEIKLTLVPISPATTAGRFSLPYVRNLMQQIEKWHKMEDGHDHSSLILPPCDSYSNRTPYSPPFVLPLGDFADPREGGRRHCVKRKVLRWMFKQIFRLLKKIAKTCDCQHKVDPWFAK